MKILIFYNYYDFAPRFIPLFIRKLLTRYKLIKLRSLINELSRRFKPNISINVLNTSNKHFRKELDFNVISLSKLRLNLDHIEYLKIRDKIVNITKQNLNQIFKNCYMLKFLNYKGIFIPTILEFEIALFLNEVFGNFEVINKTLTKKKYDKLILFNCNKNIFDFFKSFVFRFQCNIEVYNDILLTKMNKILNRMNILIFLLKIIGSYYKRFLFRRKRRSKISKNKNNKNVIFYTNTVNQFKSIFPIYNCLKRKSNLNLIHYSNEIYISLNYLTKLLRFIFQFKNSLDFHKDIISKDLSYDSIKLKGLLKLFYQKDLLIKAIKLFNLLNNLKLTLKENPPNLIVISNDFLPTGRLVAQYLKSKDIPTLFIPHAANPIIREFVSPYIIKYLALGGELDKVIYLRRGVAEENIFITGIPRYEHFYRFEIDKLGKVFDIFDGRVYNFDALKQSILLTTNPIDDTSNEKIITSVVSALKELNLINNLIIKLHPRESGRVHLRVLHKLNVKPIIVKNYDILQIIKSCDLLISQKSTTLLEAMIVGTPIILLDFINKTFKETSEYQFLSDDRIMKSQNQEELIKNIEKLTRNENTIKNYREILNKLASGFSYYDKHDPPTKKISNLILKLIEN